MHMRYGNAIYFHLCYHCVSDLSIYGLKLLNIPLLTFNQRRDIVAQYSNMLHCFACFCKSLVAFDELQGARFMLYWIRLYEQQFWRSNYEQWYGKMV
jgi:hypothetical protein